MMKIGDENQPYSGDFHGLANQMDQHGGFNQPCPEDISWDIYGYLGFYDLRLCPMGDAPKLLPFVRW